MTRLYAMNEAQKISGATARQIRHWVEKGHIESRKHDAGYQIQNFFTIDEVYVMQVMVRLISGGFTELASVESTARKHLHDVAVLKQMGYAGDSIATEHTIGDGLVLTITG